MAVIIEVTFSPTDTIIHTNYWTNSEFIVKYSFASIEELFWRKKLANIKSQIKRNKQNQAARLRNRVYRGSARTFLRKAQSAIRAEDAEKSQVEVLNAIRALDKAAAKGVIHKNNAARRKSRLMARYNSLEK